MITQVIFFSQEFEPIKTGQYITVNGNSKATSRELTKKILPSFSLFLQSFCAEQFRLLAIAVFETQNYFFRNSVQQNTERSRDQKHLVSTSTCGKILRS